MARISDDANSSNSNDNLNDLKDGIMANSTTGNITLDDLGLNNFTSGLSAELAPQDPYLPQVEPQGPSFLDTEACLCALRETPETKKNDGIWHCIGNQTENVYGATSGKWFRTSRGGSTIDGPINNAYNGPNGPGMAWDGDSKSFMEDTGKLNIRNRLCTGSNQTIMSTAFYRAVGELQRNETPVDAFPCWRPGALPVQIQNQSQWLTDGCHPGFLCANNTINSLPQYCPPIAECQQLRLAGKACVAPWNGKNIGMGPFEPILCQEGNYCPSSSKGRESIICPAGHYCHPGAPIPTPCAVGSVCPEDIALLAGVTVLKIRERRQKGLPRVSRKKKGVGAVARRMTGYKQLSHDADHEMRPMRATFMPGRDTGMGFEAALAMEIENGVPNLRRSKSVRNPQLQAFIESMERATDDADFGLSFQYSGLSLHPKGSARPILQNMTGSIERGSLVAIMGGSGAGKSTFVNVLMGKTVNTGGSVMVNNVPGKIKQYKKLIGYVPQDDIVSPELTVYENVIHSAKIRLPRTWSDEQIESHVTSIIDCLELSHVRDSRVGSVGKPILSGGQRKRVSIGMELAAAPMAIFLDEPTSGLDATAASSIMRTLKALAKLGISVIVIIHQPRMEIFEMLDDLILLGNGQTIYEGSEQNVQPFFEGLGFQFPQHSNWGDVVTDIITGNGRVYKRTGDISKEALIAHWAQYRGREGLSDKQASLVTVDKTSMSAILRARGAPRLKQTWLCLRRAMLQQYRNKTALGFEFALAALAGFLLGLAENPRKGVLFTGLYNAPYDVLGIATDFKSAPEIALLIAICVGLISGAPGVRVFSEETLLQRREAEAGHSRLAYFIAKMISSIPRMLLGCFHFSTPLLLLGSPVIGWGIAFVANLQYFYAIYGLAAVVAMVVRREDAPLFATMISLIVAILSGAAPPLSSVKQWHLEWLWRLSPGTWLAEIYFANLVQPFRYLYNVELAAEVTGFHLETGNINMATLFMIGTIYRIIAFVGLIVGKRWRI